MKKNVVHNIVTIKIWMVFVANFIRLLLAIDVLPDRIGVHFASDGSYDIYDSWIYTKKVDKYDIIKV